MVDDLEKQKTQPGDGSQTIPASTGEAHSTVGLKDAPRSDTSASSVDHTAEKIATSGLTGADERGTSTSRPAIVPRAQRRGVLAFLAVIPEVERPTEYARSTKWWMTTIVATAAGTSSVGSALFYPALHLMADAFNTTETVINLSIALYLLAMAFTPMWWSAWSETLGRRTIYITSFALFAVFGVCSAVSVNIGMLIVFRILTGGAAAAVQAVGAGTIADIWEPHERGRAMAIFHLGPLLGPGLAPVVGGVLTYELNWRAPLWAIVVFGGLLLLLIIFFLPETVGARQPMAENESKTAAAIRRFADPLKNLRYLQYPPILITVYSGGLAFAVLYVVTIAVQANFEAEPYSFNPLIIGLLYIGPTLGYLVASQVGGRYVDYVMKRSQKKTGLVDEEGKPIYLPEDRMQENVWFAATLYPLAVLWYGWSAENGVHWIVPCIANFFFGIGSMLVFSCVTTMLTEFTPKKSSVGVALNNFCRQILATIATTATQPMITAMGTGWMCTMVALFALVTGIFAIFLLKRNAQPWRAKMDAALKREMERDSRK